MPKQLSVPRYRLHKARGCAVVTIRGRNFYLGKYDSPESKEKYARLIAEQFGTGRQPTVDPANDQLPQTDSSLHRPSTDQKQRPQLVLAIMRTTQRFAIDRNHLGTVL